MSKENPKVIYTMTICWGLVVFIVWMLFLMTIGLEEDETRKEISVILYHTENNGWESLQEGIKQAEEDFPVNINYVILREEADGEEQLEAIEREIENGAKGILLAVCDYKALRQPLKDKMFQIPIVAVESGLNDDVFPLISADNYTMGKCLGEEILKDFNDRDELTVALLDDGTKRDSVQQRKKGLADALDGKAKLISLEEAEGIVVDAAVGLHKDALLALTGDGEEPVLKNVEVYGIGNTASTVAALDRGNIKKLVFQNEFNIGYLGVKALLGETDSALSVTTEKIDYYCVSRRELYGTPYEQVLFPIVE